MSSHNINRQLFTAPPMVDPGASGTINVDRHTASLGLVSATTETRTLARPTRAGGSLTIYMMTDGGDITLTITGGMAEEAATTFVFSDPGQFLELVAIADSTTTFVWRKVSDHTLGNLTPADLTILAAFSALTATVTEINARAAAASRYVNVTNAATYTVLAADSGKTHIMPDFTSSCTLALPALAAGLEYLFIGKAGANDGENWIFQTLTGGNSFLGGLAFWDTNAGAGGDETHAGVFPNGSSNDFMTIVTPGAGTRIYMICDGTNWIVNGQVLSETVPTFSDT